MEVLPFQEEAPDVPSACPLVDLLGHMDYGVRVSVHQNRRDLSLKCRQECSYLGFALLHSAHALCCTSGCLESVGYSWGCNVPSGDLRCWRLSIYIACDGATQMEQGEDRFESLRLQFLVLLIEAVAHGVTKDVEASPARQVQAIHRLEFVRLGEEAHVRFHPVLLPVA
jgi:hypothetical protein